ncbi:MAG: AAA family ATPase, partial [Nonlabens sp.]|nr:AAA family ATPase [Nonlabens sp.]
GTPRTQSALLEAMAEKQVSVDGHTYQLQRPFFVIATQNPTDESGTFPLPDSQLDRFSISLSLGYPSVEAERRLYSEDFTNKSSQPIETLIDAEQYLENSIDLAARVQNNFLRDLARKNRGVKQANFAVLRMSYMPSVLIETGFITNTEEKNFLSSDEGQQKVANAIFNSIIQYHANRDINEFVIEDIDVEKVIPEIVIPENRVDKPITSSASTSSTVKNGTVYKVQLAASSKKIAESPSNFNNLPKISRAQVGALYKYFTGAEATESAARELLAIAKSKGYAEAFIVTEKNGVISKL